MNTCTWFDLISMCQMFQITSFVINLKSRPALPSEKKNDISVVLNCSKSMTSENQWSVNPSTFYFLVKQWSTLFHEYIFRIVCKYCNFQIWNKNSSISLEYIWPTFYIKNNKKVFTTCFFLLLIARYFKFHIIAFDLINNKGIKWTYHMPNLISFLFQHNSTETLKA